MIGANSKDSLVYQDFNMTANDLYLILKDEILALKLKPGELISENSICRRFGISRTPVRSSFERLKQDGLIEVVPKKGTFITLINLNLAAQIIYMRIQVEIGAMSYLAAHPDPILFEKLHQNLKMQEALMAIGVKDKEYFDLDSEFHKMCLVAINKDELWNLIQQINFHYSRYRRLDYIVSHSYSKLYYEHVSLLECMEERRVNDIRALVTQHLYGGFYRLGQDFMTKYQDYFIDTTQETENTLLDIKKEVHEVSSSYNI